MCLQEEMLAIEDAVQAYTLDSLQSSVAIQFA